MGALCYWPLRRRLSWEYCEVTGLADSGEVDAVRQPLLLNQEEESAVGAVCYWPLRMRLSWEYCAVQLCSGMSQPWCTPPHPFPILRFIGCHISKWWTRWDIIRSTSRGGGAWLGATYWGSSFGQSAVQQCLQMLGSGACFDGLDWRLHGCRHLGGRS